MFIAARELPLPQEYRFFPLAGLVTEPPDDLDERTIVFLDCGNLERNPAEAFRRPGVAHPQHRPPPRQHPLRDGQPGRAGGLVHRRDRLGPDARARGARRRRTVAEALYVGLITDTGRFMYENTGRARPPDGRRPDRRRRRRPRDLPPRLRGRALRQARAAGPRAGQRRALRRRAADDDRADAPRTSPTPTPRRATPRASSTTCAPCRAPRWRRWSATGSATPTAGLRKVSLRAGDERVDVSAIARAQGGGGHRQAAGFTTELSHDELVRVPARAARRAALAARRRRQRSPRRPSARLRAALRQAGRDHLARRRRRACAATLPRKTKVGHAGTLDPFATGLLLVLVGRATRVQRFLMALPKRYETTARFGAVSSTGDPEGEITETGRRARRGPGAAHRRRPPAPAGLLGGQGRRPARLRAGPGGREVELAEREVEVYRFERALARRGPARVRDRVLVGHLRAQPDRRPRRRLLRAAAPDADRRLRRRRRRSRAPDRRSTTRWVSCPRCGSTPTTARRAAATASAVAGGRTPAGHASG